MYRAVALAATRRGTALHDAPGLRALLEGLRLEMPDGRVVLDGEDVSAAIRTPEVSQGASQVAASAVVRPFLAGLQRQIASGRDIVCEGRDQGTVVFPDAGCKFFLTADAEERLRRRADELGARGQEVDLDELRRAQAERDERDAGRELAPMRPADDAVLVDTTGLGPEQVLDTLEREVRRRMGAG
jgi:cytidylate kinase